MLIDTHAHLNFKAFKDDTDEVIKRTLENNVWLINIGSQYATSKKAVEIAERYPRGVYASIGLHPIHARDGFEYQKYREMAKSSSVIAVGEIGLDYKPEYAGFKEKQKQVFLEQMDFAKELDLPIIFHCRMAHQDLIEVLKFSPGRSKPRGVVHCFTGNRQQAEKYLETGFYLGFNGIIFKLNLDETIKKIPLDRILIETDCPYLTPPPMIGRNEPIFMKYVIEKIAQIKGVSYREIAEITTKNAKKLFSV